MSGKKRVTISISAENYDWYKERADGMGVTLSALLSMSLDSHKTQQAVIEHMPMLAKLEEKLAMMEQSEKEYEEGEKQV